MGLAEQMQANREARAKEFAQQRAQEAVTIDQREEANAQKLDPSRFYTGDLARSLEMEKALGHERYGSLQQDWQGAQRAALEAGLKGPDMSQDIGAYRQQASSARAAMAQAAQEQAASHNLSNTSAAIARQQLAAQQGGGVGGLGAAAAMRAQMGGANQISQQFGQQWGQEFAQQAAQNAMAQRALIGADTAQAQQEQNIMLQMRAREAARREQALQRATGFQRENLADELQTWRERAQLAAAVQGKEAVMADIARQQSDAEAARTQALIGAGVGAVGTGLAAYYGKPQGGGK